MSSILLLFVCLAIGFGLRRLRDFPVGSHLVLNRFVIYVSLPALALLHIPEIPLNREVLFPVGVPFLLFGGSVALFLALQRIWGWSNKLTGCLILTAGMANTSFVGFPVIEALFGAEGLRVAIMVDQPAFVVLTTFGVGVAAWFSSRSPQVRPILRQIVQFPPFLMFVAAIIMNLAGLHFGEMAKDVLGRLGSTVTPIALISVGMQLNFSRRSAYWRHLGLGLTYKLVLAPALVYGLYVGVLGGSGLVVQVSVMEAAMAPMITASIVASSYGLKPRLANMMIGYGIPLSFITLYFWYWWVM
jgi:malate permease and related proteins